MQRNARSSRVPLAASLACLVAAGCSGLPDGVQTYAFGLLPSQPLVLPAPAEVGVTLAALDYAMAQGRVTSTPPQQKLGFTITGLPPLGVPSDRAYYRFTLVLTTAPIPPQSASLPARLWRLFAPESEALAHGEGGTMDLGHFDADASGNAALNPDPIGAPLERTDGAYIEIAIPVGSGGVKVYKVMEGYIGNLSSSGAATTVTAGHTH